MQRKDDGRTTSFAWLGAHEAFHVKALMGFGRPPVAPIRSRPSSPARLPSAGAQRHRCDVLVYCDACGGPARDLVGSLGAGRGVKRKPLWTRARMMRRQRSSRSDTAARSSPGRRRSAWRWRPPLGACPTSRWVPFENRWGGRLLETSEHSSWRPPRRAVAEVSQDSASQGSDLEEHRPRPCFLIRHGRFRVVATDWVGTAKSASVASRSSGGTDARLHTRPLRGRAPPGPSEARVSDHPPRRRPHEDPKRVGPQHAPKVHPWPARSGEGRAAEARHRSCSTTRPGSQRRWIRSSARSPASLGRPAVGARVSSGPLGHS